MAKRIHGRHTHTHTRIGKMRRVGECGKRGERRAEKAKAKRVKTQDNADKSGNNDNNKHGQERQQQPQQQKASRCALLLALLLYHLLAMHSCFCCFFWVFGFSCWFSFIIIFFLENLNLYQLRLEFSCHFLNARAHFPRQKENKRPARHTKWHFIERKKK